jgi:hypothetical protein
MAALAAPSAASADGYPILLNAVSISPASGFENNFAYPGIVTVSFTNEGTSPATTVTFMVRGYHGRYIDEFQDVGNFAPGQVIRHTFNGVMTGSEQEAGVNVQVEKATFADGTTSYESSAPPAPVSRRQSSY